MVWLFACAPPDGGAPLPASYTHTVLPGDAAEDHRFWGAGVLAFDADGDGDLDLILPGPHETRYLRLDGREYVEVLQMETSFAVGGAAADIDGDADLDVVITRWGPEDLLWRNDGGVFVLVDAAFSIPSHSQSASFGDVDLDGDLDLAIAGHGEVEGGDQIVIPGPSDGTRLWRNDGTGTFVDASDALSNEVRDGYAYVVGWTELNGDGLPDWIVANDYPLYRPTLAARQDDTFVVAEGLGLVQRAAGMGLAIEDVNGDQVDDYLIPVWDRVLLLRSSPGGVWVDAAASAGLVPPPRAEAWVGWGAEWADLDLDGDLDAVVAFGHLDVLAPLTAGGGSSANAELQRFAVYRNDGERFAEVAPELDLDQTGVWRGFAVADLDRNGAPDLVRRDLDGDVWVDWAAEPSAGWVRVIVDPPAQAVGATVTIGLAPSAQPVHGGAPLTAASPELVLRRVIHAGGTSLASSGPPEALFGLGAATAPEWIEVRWPNGVVRRVQGAAGEHHISGP